MEATPLHIAAIHRFLDALGHRERSILTARALLWLCCLLVGALVVGSLGFSSGFSRQTVALILGIGGVPSFGLWLTLVLRPQWRRAGTLRWQARQVEARLPGLRSRMITVVDRSVQAASGQAPFSMDLWARAANHAQAAVSLIGVSDVHPWRRARRAGAGLGGLALLGLLLGSVLPVGPLDALDILLGKSAALVRLEAASSASAEDRALVGDITLRYIFPDYMGMDPVEVPNSDGTIHAPPGTRVQITARTAEVFDAAAIQVDQQDPLDAGLTAGRDLTATVTVEMEGAWRFLLFSGDKVLASPDYKIVVEADQPPVVVTSETGEISRAVDEPLNLRWQVTDDYGVATVTMEIVKDGEMVVTELRSPIDPVLEISGRVRQTPRRMGLRPGDKVSLRVVAMDTDKASGGNRGESEEIVIEVLGPKGVGRRLTAYHRKLRGALLIALADFLEEPVPPADQPRGMLRWARKTRNRLDRVRQVYKDQWGEEQSEGMDGIVVRDVMEKSGRLYRFTVVTFDTGTSSGVSGRKAVEKDYRTFSGLHTETVSSLERAVWMIDEMLQQVAYREVARQAQEVAQEAQELSEMAEDNPDAQQLLARLDQLERLMSRLKDAAARLSEGQFKEFVNSRLSEAQGQMDAIRKAISEGRIEDAQRMIKDLAEQLNQFAEGMKEQMSRSGQKDDELAKRFKQLMKDLESMQGEQTKLADELAVARGTFGGDFDQAMVLWERLDKLAASAVARSDAMLSRVGDGRGYSPRTIQRAEVSGQEVRGTRDAVRARDVRGALERVLSAQRYAMMVEQAFRREKNGLRMDGDEPPRDLKEASEEARRMSVVLQEMRSLLDKMMDQPGESSPELESEARKLSSRQTELRQRQRQLSQEVQTVERAIPTGDGTAQESMQRAGQAMDQAFGALDRGEAMQGEGHQRDAARKIQETRDALQRAQQQQQQMQQEMRRMEGEGEGSGARDGGQDHPNADLEQPEIPTPEAFKTPEAYRRALLEGMAEGVPEEFEALKKRFYEELVRQ